MPLVLEMLRKMSLESVTYSIHQRDEHENGGCGDKLDEHCNCYCDGSCRRYLLCDGQYLDRNVLEQVARERHVELKDGVWDFGEWVIRQVGFGALQRALPRVGTGS